MKVRLKTPITKLMSLLLKNSLWVRSLVAWVCSITIFATIYWNLAVGYSWTLPLIGTVAGPSTPFQQSLFTAIIILAALLGAIASILVILQGSWAQRFVILAPTLVFLSVGVAVIYQTISTL